MAVVEFIQQVTIVIAANATSNTATITAVNPNTSLEQITGYCNTALTTMDASKNNVSITLTNSTTLTATRNTADASNSITINATVTMHLLGAIQSVQRGSITLTAATSNTATVSSVTTGNAAVQYNGSNSTNTGFSWDIIAGYMVLTNATTITYTRGTGTNNLTGNYCLIEYASGVLNSSTQAATIVIASATASKTATITSVTTGQSMSVYGGFTSASAGGAAFASNEPYLTLTNSTTMTETRFGTNSQTVTGAGTIIEYKSSDIKSVNRGTLSYLATDQTKTATITAVDTTRCIANWLGQVCVNATGQNPSLTCTILALSNPTTITGTRNTGATDTLTESWEAIEFTILIDVFAASDALYYKQKNENFLYPSVFDCPHIPAFFGNYFQDAWAIPDSVPYYKKPENRWINVVPVYQSNPGTIKILYGDAWEVNNQVRYYPRPNFWWTQLPEKYEANPANIGIFYAGAWEVNNQVRYYPQRNYWWSELPEIMQFEPGSIGILFTAAWTTQIVGAAKAAKNFGFLQATPVIGLDPTHVVIDEFIIRARRRGRR